MGSAQLALAESNACAGQTEPGSKHAISEQCPLRRVDAAPTNGSGIIASEDNTHCQTYFLKDRSNDWPNLLLYAFPPIGLITQVIRRIREHKHRVLLVAPFWRNLNWFAELSRLLTAGSIHPALSPSRHGICPQCWGLWRALLLRCYSLLTFGTPMGVRTHSTRGIATSGRGQAVCPLQRYVRRPAGPHHLHLPGFIIWKFRP